MARAKLISTGRIVDPDNSDAKLSVLWDDPLANYVEPSEIRALIVSATDVHPFTDAEQTKLTGVQAGATANDTNANLRDRQTHTGQQAIATITDLQAGLDARLQASNNLSDLADAPTAQGNLGLGSAATSEDSDFAPASHQHTKSEITDFNEGDYATAAQGSKADSSVQPGDASFVSDGSNNNLGQNPNFWIGSQADYDALGSYDQDTIYYTT